MKSPWLKPSRQPTPKELGKTPAGPHWRHPGDAGLTSLPTRLNFWELLQHVVLSQTVTIALPPAAGFLVRVVKGTALASVIGFIERTKAGFMVSNATFKPFILYSCDAQMYFYCAHPPVRLKGWRFNTRA
jgi:hypothetical protein